MTIGSILQKLRGRVSTHPHLRERLGRGASELVDGNEWEERCDRCKACHDLLQTRLVDSRIAAEYGATQGLFVCDYCLTSGHWRGRVGL